MSNLTKFVMALVGLVAMPSSPADSCFCSAYSGTHLGIWMHRREDLIYGLPRSPALLPALPVVLMFYFFSLMKTISGPKSK